MKKGQNDMETRVMLIECIWAEALGGDPDRLDRYAGKEIRDIIAKLPEWRHCVSLRKSVKPYGRQRYYARRKKT